MIDNLKTIAVSRLMLENFDHIKAYWVMLGKSTAQTALHFGANAACRHHHRRRRAHPQLLRRVEK